MHFLTRVIPQSSHLLLGILGVFCALSIIRYSAYVARLSIRYSTSISFSQTFDIVAASGKTLLVWTRFNGAKHDFDADPPTWFENCPQSKCFVTSNRDRLKDVDAVFFSMPDFKHNDLPHSFYRRPAQYYVFYDMESPDTIKEMYPYKEWDTKKNFFNLTFTYRFDSDVYDGAYLNDYHPHLINTETRDALWFHGRRDVLWMASHCPTMSKREDYVRELQKYMDVDILGGCGEEKVRERCANGICAKTAEYMARYKFYLAFENSFCKDYTTEKLFRALNHDVVPVVMGGLRYDKLFPPKAVINVADYASAEELAKYLRYLIKNVTAYEEHLAWKYPGEIVWHLPGVPDRQHNSWCALCDYLHRPATKRIYKSYYSINKWFFNGQCFGDYTQAINRLRHSVSLTENTTVTAVNKPN